MNPSVRDVGRRAMFLSGRPDICSGRIGIAGAQVGANLAIVEAASDPLVRSLALLSPGVEYRRVRAEAAMRKYNERPALILASTEDAYATRSARELSTLGAGIRDLRLLTGAGHGTTMLARQPDLIGCWWTGFAGRCYDRPTCMKPETIAVGDGYCLLRPHCRLDHRQPAGASRGAGRVVPAAARTQAAPAASAGCRRR